MDIIEQVPTLDQILEQWRPQLADDYSAYRNHCYRVLNLCLALCADEVQQQEKIAIAVAFHDLGIWAENTFDYLAPSQQLATEYLNGAGKSEWSREIAAMIENHHRFSQYKMFPEWLVEPFRKADWIDVSRGRLRFGLPRAYLHEVMQRFPNAGFHKKLVDLTLKRWRTHPFSPLPMMRL